MMCGLQVYLVFVRSTLYPALRLDIQVSQINKAVRFSCTGSALFTRFRCICTFFCTTETFCFVARFCLPALVDFSRICTTASDVTCLCTASLLLSRFGLYLWHGRKWKFHYKFIPISCSESSKFFPAFGRCVNLKCWVAQRWMSPQHSRNRVETLPSQYVASHSDKWLLLCHC